MAEENHQSYSDDVTHDDQSVMRHLLKTVRGLSPISLTPMLDDALAQDSGYGEQFEFE